jgi:hypothetical protein
MIIGEPFHFWKIAKQVDFAGFTSLECMDGGLQNQFYKAKKPLFARRRRRRVTGASNKSFKIVYESGICLFIRMDH